MKSLKIELPGIKAVSRNQTTGHFTKYQERLNEAEEWMIIHGRKLEHHFTERVDVEILAYYDARGNKKPADTPNVDDKIFTDTLIRYKPSQYGRIERNVWFIEDDNPKYLRRVIKEAIPSDHYKVVIIINSI